VAAWQGRAAAAGSAAAAAAAAAAHPRTRTPCSRASATTPSNRWRLSSMLQLMFLRLNASLAAPKMATSSTPAFSAPSRPLMFGVSAV
jgi:hypothetical protein